MSKYKKEFRVLVFCLIGIIYVQVLPGQISPNSQWSWRGGNAHQVTVRGTIGQASAFYTPGERVDAINLKDPDGNLWVYGGRLGEDLSHIFGDLWFFNAATDQWTWVWGPATANPLPVYGTFRNGNTTTSPGRRMGSFGWFDTRNNKLWIYGGEDLLGVNNVRQFRNDLWCFDLQTHIWTWMAGGSNANENAVGSSFASPSNTPGGRYHGAAWYVDNNIDPFDSFTSESLPPRSCAKLYLAFGFGFVYGSPSIMDDVWVFNTDDNNWMFLKFTDPVVNGNQTTPFRRFRPQSWSRAETGSTDITTRDFLYCFGGYGQDRTASYGNLNDIWKYDVLSNEWSYVTGSYYINPASSSSSPGGTSSWYTMAAIDDAKAYVYLYGETGNNLWRFNLDSRTWTNLFATQGTYIYGIQFSQDLNTRPPWGEPGRQGIWFVKNRLCLFTWGSIFSLFDPCTSNSITATPTTINDPSDSVTFTCNAIGSGPITYLWRKNNSVASLVSSPTYKTADILPTDAYSCFVTTAAGCASNIRLVSYSNNIFIAGKPPANDEPCGAIELTLNASPQYGNTAFATSTNDVPGNCYGATNTLWYKFIPTNSGFVQFTLGGGLNGDTLNAWIGAFIASSGGCPSLSLTDSNATTFGFCKYYYPNGGNKNAAVWSSFLTAGKTYYFRISGINGDIGRYSFSLQSTDITTIASGNWQDPAIWSNKRVPTAQSNVVITFPVTVDANGICKSLTVQNGAQVTVMSNVTLTILKQ